MKRQPTYSILSRFLKKSGVKRGKKTLRIFYGETVDEFGMPIDSFKYYFALSLMAKKINANATVVVADVASLLNDSVIQKHEQITRSLNRRVALFRKIISVYRLPIGIRLMSDIFKTDEYKKLREHMRTDGIESILAKTVPVNKLEEERKKNFQYALDAIATGLLFDFKIGPPRERFYDEAGERIMPGKLTSMYLSPTYPLGQNFAFFLTHPEIEEYGVTPYKAGSNKLQDYRIILGETSLVRASELIRSSFESFNNTAHPIFDLYDITQMAKQHLIGVSETKKFQSIDELKEGTIREVGEYILKPLEVL